jgi:hypothetical protein
MARHKLQRFIPIVVVLVLTVVGVHILTSSNASTQQPYVTSIASSGNLGGAASVVSVSGASTGKVVQFGYTPTTALAVHVVDGQLVNGLGRPERLLGVDASGTEDACIQNKGLSWGALNASEATAMTTWDVKVVRVPLNEDCWLGINGSPTAYSGAIYQNAIKTWVANLNNAGFITIIDLHWSAPGTYPATQRWPMADADHTPTFWSQVASTFKADQAVIFDPFNEPLIGQGAPTASNWSCWLNGCSTTFTGTINGVANSSVTYTTAGMQQLVNAIRGAGANQPIMVGGLNWAGDPCGLKNSGGNGGVCTQVATMPSDPDHQLAISFHTYNWTACITTACWNTMAQAAKTAKLPIITGEMGERDCSDSYINSYMAWADQNDISYLAWSWEINYQTSCVGTNANGTLQLLSNWSGAPSSISPEGADYKQHLLSLGL